jgi:hypothetical protein
MRIVVCVNMNAPPESISAARDISLEMRVLLTLIRYVLSIYLDAQNIPWQVAGGT